MEIVVPQTWTGYTIEHILQNVWHAPKAFLHRLRMDKGVKLNGETVVWSSALSQGQRLLIHIFQEEDFGVIPEFLPIEPIYEDDHLLIVNKPAGMDTHPNEAGQRGTLANGVAFHWQTNGLLAKVRHIHRLDRDTTGGVVFAKHALSGAILDRMLTSRSISRTYIAFVHGLLKTQKGTINYPIGRDRHHPTRRRVSERGDRAVTHFELIETFPKMRLSLVKLRLETGRTHQIRVHLSHIGHPIIGDDLYGGKTDLLGRQALHANRIEFIHPFTDQTLDTTIHWPPDLLRLKDSIL